MRIIIATTQAPFIRGGAEIHAEELCQALHREGQEAEIVAIPFFDYPPERVLDSMLVCRLLDLSSSYGKTIDRVIALKFPAYLVSHPCKVLWILHQYRQAYELWDNPIFQSLESGPLGAQIRDSVIRADNHVCAEAHAIFSNSRNVAKRLKAFNQVNSQPLYHPPRDAERFYCEAEEGYFFFPSRMNSMKRQDLIIEALSKTNHPVKVLFAGKAEGNFNAILKQKVEQFGLGERALFVGSITDQQKLEYYAKALGVIYPPFEEDYGYVTLEGMLAAKPVLTCQDSGGPLEFIEDRQTGLVAEPNPLSLAKGMDELWDNRAWAIQLGQAARARYQDLNITWSNVIQKLLA